jgi:hypothetical protein
MTNLHFLQRVRVIVRVKVRITVRDRGEVKVKVRSCAYFPTSSLTFFCNCLHGCHVFVFVPAAHHKNLLLNLW